MTCTTCGRENPPHLTFCQECGQRLGPRIAPPTPPIGLGAQDSSAGAYGPPPLGPNPFAQHQQRAQPPHQQQPAPPAQEAYRPSGGIGAPPPPAPPPLDPRALPPRVATSLGMTARADGPPAYMTPPPPPPYVPQPAAQVLPSGERRCKVCETVNAPNLRYCTSCGSTLEAQAPGVAPSPREAPTPPPPAPAAAQDRSDAAIAPMRVVDLAGGKPAPREVRTCSRCRGVADPGAQFCKFCGASLGDPIPAANGSSPKIVEATADAYAPTPGAPPVLPPVLPSPSPERVVHRGPTSPMPVREPPPPAPRPIRDSGDRPFGAPIASAMREASPAPQPARDPYGPPPVQPPASAYGPPPARETPARETPAREAPAREPPPPVPAAQPSRASAPGAATRGRLVVIAKSGADGPSYPFGDSIDVGRVEGNIIVGEDPYLSPRHVRIVFSNGKLLLRDLGSTNGVFLRLAPIRDMNGKREAGGETAIPLVDQDLILVGQQVLRFEILKEAEGGLGPAQEHGTLLFGSPAAPRYARLGQRTVEGITRDVYYVRKVETVLGRESGDVVFTEDPFLSRRHAAIRVLGRDGSPLQSGAKVPVGDARFALVDLGSSNGTFLRIRGDIELHSGDHFRVGQQLFRVDLNSDRNA
jgi:pSer/pThr/pTyr-binding forkhead associated (FHA) protein